MIIPLPAHFATAEGALPIGADTQISASGEAAATARYLSEELKARTGHRLAISDTQATHGIALIVDANLSRLGDEGYQLHVMPSGAVIQASKAAGLFYGTQSLLQLLDRERVEGRSGVPAVEIEDAPRYGWRGFMLDSARHFQSMATIRRILDQMAYLKLNVFHWHLTDDQGWRLEIKRYPKLTEEGSRRPADEPGGAGFYSQKDIREIVSYARDRHITIVPEIEVPAHCTAAMACYPELTCSGKHEMQGGIGLHHFNSAAGEGAIFCAGREETYEFIHNVLNEVMDLFPSPVIHMGGDERPEGIWSNCPCCKAVMEKEGLKTESALQGYFMRRACAFVNSRGRRTMAWCPTIEHGLPAGQIAEDWFFDLIPGIAKQGHDAVNARDRFTYLDYPNYPGRQKPSWMPDLNVQRMYEFNPTPAGLTPEQEKRVLGSEASLWTEFVEDRDLSESMFPRLLGFAEVVWTPAAGREWTDFESRMKGMEKPLSAMGITYAAPAASQPVRTARPATVTTSMSFDPAYRPEHAFDGRFVRCFATNAPPRAGDHLTITLNKPADLRRITLYAGADAIDGALLEDGSLEISNDGKRFSKAADIHAKQTDVDLPGTPVKAIRVTVNADMTHNLAITEIAVK
jgi:hexosaminidase